MKLCKTNPTSPFDFSKTNPTDFLQASPFIAQSFSGRFSKTNPTDLLQPAADCARPAPSRSRRGHHPLRHRGQTGTNRRHGTISVEYLLVLALVVIPLAAMLPLFISMIQQYADRITSLMRLPFP